VINVSAYVQFVCRNVTVNLNQDEIIKSIISQNRINF